MGAAMLGWAITLKVHWWSNDAVAQLGLGMLLIGLGYKQNLSKLVTITEPSARYGQYRITSKVRAPNMLGRLLELAGLLAILGLIYSEFMSSRMCSLTISKTFVSYFGSKC